MYIKVQVIRDDGRILDETVFAATNRFTRQFMPDETPRDGPVALIGYDVQTNTKIVDFREEGPPCSS